MENVGRTSIQDVDDLGLPDGDESPQTLALVHGAEDWPRIDEEARQARILGSKGAEPSGSGATVAPVPEQRERQSSVSKFYRRAYGVSTSDCCVEWVPFIGCQ